MFVKHWLGQSQPEVSPSSRSEVCVCISFSFIYVCTGACTHLSMQVVLEDARQLYIYIEQFIIIDDAR